MGILRFNDLGNLREVIIAHVHLKNQYASPFSEAYFTAQIVNHFQRTEVTQVTLLLIYYRQEGQVGLTQKMHGIKKVVLLAEEIGLCLFPVLGQRIRRIGYRKQVFFGNQTHQFTGLQPGQVAQFKFLHPFQGLSHGMLPSQGLNVV